MKTSTKAIITRYIRDLQKHYDECEKELKRASQALHDNEQPLNTMNQEDYEEYTNKRKMREERRRIREEKYGDVFFDRPDIDSNGDRYESALQSR